MCAATALSTPATDGFHMPAEFELHDGCYLIWPHRPDVWRQQGAPAQSAFVAVAAAIADSERVTVLVAATQLEKARRALPPIIDVVEMASDDAWVRDTGPTIVVDERRGQRRGVDWRFNAWGGEDSGLYRSWSQDDALASKVCRHEGMESYRAPLVLEGGSIQVDGEGTCLTTLECLGHANRNPALSVAELEAHLCAYLGVERVVWLPQGIPFDETDGHVDNLATFVGPGRVLLTWTEDRADPLAEVTLEARRLLESSRDARGRAFEVVPVPAPRLDPVRGVEADGIMVVPGTKPRRAGDPVAASYVNCYIGNTVVVFPCIDLRHDEEVADLLAALFPGRRPVGVPARELLLGGGGIHCLTQQLAAIGHGATAEPPP